MSRQASRPLQAHQWIGWPMLLCLAASVVLATPLRVFGLRLPEPVFPMVLAFAWAVIRPSLIGPLALLVSGSFLDLLWGTPLGLWGLCLLLAYAAALLSRSLMTGRSAPMLAAWYLGLTGLAFTAAYLFVMLRAHVTPDLMGVLYQLVATLVLYPFAWRLIESFEDADIRFK